MVRDPVRMAVGLRPVEPLDPRPLAEAVRRSRLIFYARADRLEFRPTGGWTRGTEPNPFATSGAYRLAAWYAPLA